MVKVILSKKVAFEGTLRGCMGWLKGRLWQVPVENYFGSELLPPGEWDVVHNGNGSGESHWGCLPDPNRFAFLIGLNPIRIVSYQCLGGRKYKYQGFIVSAATGKHIALVDAPFSGNALYAFDASMPSWLAVATLTKKEIQERNDPEWLAWISHKGNWQRRVRGLLAKL